MRWDWITHQIVQMGRRRFRIEALRADGTWGLVGVAASIEAAERIVGQLKRPRPRRAVEDTWAAQDNLPRGSASSSYLTPSSDRGCG